MNIKKVWLLFDYIFVQVVEDIFKSLKFKSVKQFKLPSFRKNIFYDVKFTDVIGKLNRVLLIILPPVTFCNGFFFKCSGGRWQKHVDSQNTKEKYISTRFYEIEKNIGWIQFISIAFNLGQIRLTDILSRYLLGKMRISSLFNHILT